MVDYLMQVVSMPDAPRLFWGILMAPFFIGVLKVVFDAPYFLWRVFITVRAIIRVNRNATKEDRG